MSGVGAAPWLAAGLVLAAAGAVRAAVRLPLAGRTRARVRHGSAAPRRGLVPPPGWLARRLASADLAGPGPALWAAWRAGAGAMAAVAGVLYGPGAAAVSLVAAAAGPLVALSLLGGQADRRLEEALPDALEGVARSLRGGASLHQAVTETAPAAPTALAGDLRRVVAEADHGAGLVAALDGWARRRPLPGVRLAVAALALGAETGGAQASAVDGVAATIRARLAVAAEVRALSSQARLSGLVIALAPLAFGALAAGADARSAEFLLRTPLGLACLVAGLALDGAAAMWMHRLTRIEA